MVQIRWSVPTLQILKGVNLETRDVMSQPAGKNQTTSNNSPSDDFRLKEYELLRGEIQSRMSNQSNLERYVVIAVATTYGVLATLENYKIGENVTILAPFFWWIPVAILVLGFCAMVC
jgi:hypothetical protein